MNAATGLGIAGLVIAIFGALTPFIGLYLGWFALLVVSVAALMGDRGLTIATVIISALAFIFLTPSLWVGEGLRAMASSSTAPMPPRLLLPITAVMLAAPVVCMLLGRKASGQEIRSAPPN